MAGVVSPGMPVVVVERACGRRAYAPVIELTRSRGPVRAT
ncbi:DUF1116 domain-containing protein [Pseudonocardia sp. MCCB 268]|nr:DUF1116 domain-containing protein [Pseudonocardia cytotoxica]